jgi:hypothetical protein
MKIGTWELHPACVLLPPLGLEEFRELLVSIDRLGQLEPIARWSTDGSILDGRNRLEACIKLGREPIVQDVETDNPFEWVWSRNIDRRHIEPGRRAALRLEFNRGMLELIEAAAKRQRSGLRRGRVPMTDSPEPTPASAEGVSPDAIMPRFHEVAFAGDDSVRETLPARDRDPVNRPRRVLASASGTTPRTAGKAIQVFQQRPDLHADVCAGRISLEKAHREVRRGSPDPEWTEHEAYYTPAWVVELLVSSGFMARPSLAVEPCVGDGSLVRALLGFCRDWVTMDVREVAPAHEGLHITGSWLGAMNTLSRRDRRLLAKADLVISNSGFEITQQVVEATWELCPNAVIWILQRRTWHDSARADWFADHQPDELNVSPRIRFRWPNGKLVGTGTDNSIHTWYGFAPGVLQPCPGPNGGISRTLVGHPDESEDAE